MRLRPLPIGLILALAWAAPALAAEREVAVTDFEFTPREQRIDVGDTVAWSFDVFGHTSTAVRGQAAYWSSGRTTVPEGRVYRHTFDTPGRFQYVCVPHRDFMRGVIQVGEDEVKDTVDRFRTRRSGRTVTLSFILNEAAKATYKLRGAARKTVTRKRLRPGRRTIKLRNLEAGSYSGTLTLEDDFDKKVRPRNSFTIR
jgi:plastocyanin